MSEYSLYVFHTRDVVDHRYKGLVICDCCGRNNHDSLDRYSIIIEPSLNSKLRYKGRAWELYKSHSYMCCNICYCLLEPVLLNFDLKEEPTLLKSSSKLMCNISKVDIEIFKQFFCSYDENKKIKEEINRTLSY